MLCRPLYLTQDIVCHEKSILQRGAFLGDIEQPTPSIDRLSCDACDEKLTDHWE